MTATAAAYEKALKAQLETDRAKLPAHIITLLDKLSLTDQIEWIAANRETVAAPSGQPPAQAKRVPGTPDPAGSKAVTDAELQKRQDEERRRARNSF